MKIVILTGAGISAESGLHTFRADNGLWENHKVEDVCTPRALEKNPTLVYEFYNNLRRKLNSGDIHPNPAHKELARLEDHINGLDDDNNEFTLITQNVDNLHERGGSKAIIHMHGSLNSYRCTACNSVGEYMEDFTQDTSCPHCSESALRPNIVFFEEMPLMMDVIDDKLRSCDIFCSIGTSGNVYPASGFVRFAKEYGAKTIEFNLNNTLVSDFFDETIIGESSKTVKKWVDDYIQGGS